MAGHGRDQRGPQAPKASRAFRSARKAATIPTSARLCRRDGRSAASISRQPGGTPAVFAGRVGAAGGRAPGAGWALGLASCGCCLRGDQPDDAWAGGVPCAPAIGRTVAPGLRRSRPSPEILIAPERSGWKQPHTATHPPAPCGPLRMPGPHGRGSRGRRRGRGASHIPPGRRLGRSGLVAPGPAPQPQPPSGPAVGPFSLSGRRAGGARGDHSASS
jgi:hypothetical protein